MKIYSAEYHNVIDYREAEISDELVQQMKDNNIDITDMNAVMDYINDNDELYFETTNQYWVSYDKGSYDVDYSIEPFDRQYS
jgi:frataxin-like iron-binding protein CyaY